MEFVDKEIGKERSHILLKNFLDRCKKIEPYPTDLYEAMKSDVEPDTAINPDRKSTYKLILEQILTETSISINMPYGEGYCSYCMRTIKANDLHSTLEHVIPNKTKTSESYNQYYKVNTKLEKREMVFRDVFINRHHCNASPFPHNVAYENLVSSCDGSLPKGSQNHICCNGPRGDDYIPPLLFIPEIHEQIKYKKSGIVIWSANDEVDKRERFQVINKLNLNCDILRVVRLIWCYLAENNLTHQMDIKDKRRVIDILQSRSASYDIDMLNNFRNNNYWDILEDYQYFNDKTRFS